MVEDKDDFFAPVLREEKLQYYKELSKKTSREKHDEYISRTEELVEEGMQPSEAILQVEGEKQEAIEMLRDEQERAKGKGKEQIPDYQESEEPESGLKADFLNLKQKVKSGWEKAEEIGEEIVGTKERTKLKEAVFGGASKLYEALKGKPKTEAEKKRAKELKETYESEAHSARLRQARSSGRRVLEPRESGEPSLRDIGKGSMGTERYERSSTPDFFGKSSGFDMGIKSPMGESRKPRGESRPPSTKIPFGGSRAPDTGIPFGGNRPPSTQFHSGRKAPATYVPTQKGRAPSVKFTGAKKVSTRVPKGERKAPVILKKRGRPVSTRIGKPLTPKTKIVKQEDEDILGLKNFW